MLKAEIKNLRKQLKTVRLHANTKDNLELEAAIEHVNATVDRISEQLSFGEINKEADESAVSWIRSASRQMGFGFTFVDDEFLAICSLASRAIEAGLINHLHEDVQKTIKPLPKDFQVQ